MSTADDMLFNALARISYLEEDVKALKKLLDKTPDDEKLENDIPEIDVKL